ncbi:MAG TPA: methionyl-tRNA formyltransferase [Thermoanaerobaculia bacterium]|jgi:methionyl-tRNA formyltransferase|nr:methionyl-tRNA formyltransferase [Thermoanaerobaculia bacterium]
MPGLDRILFFGTPDFAVPTLAALVAAERAPVRVVTQPARPVGRGRRPQDPPVAAWAREHGLEVTQPERVRSPAFLAEAAALAADVAVVVAFGQIFPRALLDLPRHGCINLHASLLPRWRGASPIQAAIAAGDERTGVTTMLMEEGLDSGPILLQEETAIGAVETADELSRRLAEMGGGLMVQTLERLERGDLEHRPQTSAGVTYAARLTRDSGRVDWSLKARQITDRLRAYTPWPGLTAELRGEPVKVIAAEIIDGNGAAAVGTILGLRGGRLAVACGGGTVLGLAELQRPGKRALRAADFVNGERLQAGEVFS